MAPIEHIRRSEAVTGQERALELRLGSLGGIELRPTRLFVWKGSSRDETQRVVAFGERPSGLDYPRHETVTRAGGVEVRTLGNPLMTLALAGVIAFKRWADAPEEPDEPGR